MVSLSDARANRPRRGRVVDEHVEVTIIDANDSLIPGLALTVPTDRRSGESGKRFRRRYSPEAGVGDAEAVFLEPELRGFPAATIAISARRGAGRFTLPDNLLRATRDDGYAADLLPPALAATAGQQLRFGGYQLSRRRLRVNQLTTCGTFRIRLTSVLSAMSLPAKNDQERRGIPK
jgi:hypothetical protein